MIGISEKQGEMLAFIEKFVAKNGYPPTYEEIRVGLNISTKSLVNYHLEALENAALLKRVPNTPRGLQLTGENGYDLPHAATKIEQNESPIPLDSQDVIELTYEMVMNKSNLFALKAEGDTIIDPQAAEADIVILQRQGHAKNGELIVVKLPDRQNPELKRYYRENGHVRLEPTVRNGLQTLLVKPNALQIQGKVVAVIRQVDEAVN